MAFGKTVSTRAIQSVLINHPIGTESQQDDCLQLKEEKPPKEHQDDDVSWDNWIKKDEQVRHLSGGSSKDSSSVSMKSHIIKIKCYHSSGQLQFFSFVSKHLVWSFIGAFISLL